MISKPIKASNKCVSRLARHIPHYTALSNAAAPNSECQTTPAAGASRYVELASCSAAQLLVGGLHS